MIRKLQKISIAAVAVGIAFGTSLMAMAQSGSANDPAVVIAIKSINGQLDDVKYIGEKAGFGDQAAAIPFMARGFLGGIDLKKPAGVAIWFEGEEPVGVGMIPITDIDVLLDQLATYGVNVEEVGELYFLETPAEDMVIKVKDGYAFISNSEESLANIPADPAAILGGVSKDYMVGAKLFVQRIPLELREMAIEAMEEGFQQALNEMDSEAMADLQREANEMQVKQLIELVENSDSLQVGLGVQKAIDKLVFDMSFTGLPGSKMAQQVDAVKGKTSKFTKFLVDSAAMSMNGFGVVMDDDKKATTAMLASLKQSAMTELDENGDMSSDELEMVKGLLGDLIDIMSSTVDGGFVDFGGAVMMNEEGFNLAAGAHLASGEKFDAMIAKISGMAKTQNEVSIEVSDATVAGVGMKKMVVTLPEGVDEQAIDMFGESITVLMGRQGDAAYMALGTDPAAAFESVMSNSDTAIETTSQMNIRVLPILKFATRNPEAEGVLGPVLAGFKSTNDRITMHQKVIPNGMSMQGAADADLIKLIADIAQMAQRGGGFPGADF